MEKLSPVLKWAGGKTQLVSTIMRNIPASFNNYHEPFAGGASVALSLHHEYTFINDINRQLINLYCVIRDSSDLLIDKVNELDAIECTCTVYQNIREQYNKKIAKDLYDIECAAYMIWINKHCFNGLYRVNKKGLFNVPYNNKIRGKSIDEANVRGISDFFNDYSVTITCHDFEEACESVKCNDFVYFDSPYIPVSETASFTDYTVDGFSLEDHKRLADQFHRLDRKGAKMMLSNNDVPLVHELYEGYHIQPVSVRRLINRDASKRTGQEVLITNY